MPADCYWCKTNCAPGSVPSPIGKRDQSIGCCLKCHVLACGEHSVRDKFKQEFKCWDCLFIKLISSAVYKADINPLSRQILEEWEDIFISVYQQVEDTFTDFDDFLKGNPEFKTGIINLINIPINFDLWSFEVQPVFRSFPIESKKFLIAAAYLIVNVEGVNMINEFDSKLKYHLSQIINNSILR